MFKDGMSKFVCTHKLIWNVLKISSIPILYIHTKSIRMPSKSPSQLGITVSHNRKVLQEFLS